MTDYYDRAQALEARQREAALAAHRAGHAGAGQDHCEDCDGEIPVPRRAAVPGCTRCVACQASHEQRRSRWPMNTTN